MSGVPSRATACLPVSESGPLDHEFIGGGLVASSPPAWVSGGRCIVGVFGRFLRLYTLPTSFKEGDVRVSLLTRTLGSHERRITAVIALDSTRVASASHDGTVHIWDVEGGNLLRTKDLGVKIEGLVRRGKQDRVWALEKKGLWDVSVNGSGGSKKVASWRHGDIIVGNGDGRILVVAKKKVFSVMEMGMEDSSVRRRLTIRHKERITSLAVHSRNGMIAVGDKRGRITIYFGLISDGKGFLNWPPPNTKRRGISEENFSLRQKDVEHSTIHWHSSSVLSLVFTISGDHLMSGGFEATLVVWNMQKTNFGSRVFRPRLGGAIVGMCDSPDSSIVALCTADNAVRLVSSSSRTVIAEARGMSIPLRFTAGESSFPKKGVTYSSLGITFGSSSGGNADNDGTSKGSEISPLASIPSISLVPDCSAPGAVLVSGLNTGVQLYDVLSQTHILHFPVVRRNIVHIGAFVNEAYVPVPPVITCVASTSSKPSFVRKNVIFATVDFQMYRVGGEWGQRPKRHLETLRVFQVEEIGSQLELYSLIRAPHGHSGITSSTVFHPKLDILVTTSAAPEGEFKLWAPVRDWSEVTQPGDKRQWKPRGKYTYRQLPCYSSGWSPDGSLLAVAAGHAATLWRFDDGNLELTLVQKFTNGLSNEDIRAIAFVGAVGNEVLVTLSRAGANVWDPLNASISWSIRVPIRLSAGLAIDADDGRFAVVAETKSDAYGGTKEAQNAVVMLSAKSPVPVGVWRAVSGREILSAAFVRGRSPAEVTKEGNESAVLVYVDNAMEMFGVGTGLKFALKNAALTKAPEEKRDYEGKIRELLGPLAAASGPDTTDLSLNEAIPSMVHRGTKTVQEALENVFAVETHTMGDVSSVLETYVTLFLSGERTDLPLDNSNYRNTSSMEYERAPSCQVQGGVDPNITSGNRGEGGSTQDKTVSHYDSVRIKRFQNFFSSLREEMSGPEGKPHDVSKSRVRALEKPKARRPSTRSQDRQTRSHDRREK